MPQRIFLGYDRPFLPNLVGLLLDDRDSLPHTLLLVPTSQSGRTLRESLAAKASAILAPTISTPGALLHMDDPSIAPKWLEKIAWIETLESISPDEWSNYEGFLPKLPADTSSSQDWATSLATEINSLRTTLQDHLHDLSSAARILKNTPEAQRWDDLAQLESLALKKLSSWGYISRTTALRSRFQLPKNYQKIILAGITEIPPCLAVALENFTGEVIAIIPAPESEKSNFSSLGLPLESWKERTLPTNAKVELHANPSSQADAAIQAISTTSLSSDQFAIGSTDEQTGTTLTRALTDHGWPAFHPASKQALPPLTRWLHAWKNWLSDANSKNLAALLSLPESSSFIAGNRASTLQLFNELRDRSPAIDPERILILITKKTSQESDLYESISSLLKERESFLRAPFSQAISQHLESISPENESTADSIAFIHDFLSNALPVFSKIKRKHLFWLSILISEIPAQTPEPSNDRVIDVQGWLELLFEPGPNLIICGMNDSFVPARSGGEPWLSENIRKLLGITSDADRHARDSFLLHTMVNMRAAKGSVLLLCGKSSATGDSYLPSRLLLQTSRQNLIPTVKNLFREIEPPEANLVWTRDWQWQTPKTSLPENLSVTSLSDYLACPFRFYLKHLTKTSRPEPDRREMNHRDFGNIAHYVLEIWGNDADARNIADPKKLAEYFDSTLEQTILQKFGKKPPLAIRIQTHSLRQRLEWFAYHQTETLQQGWEIIHVERKIAIPSGQFTIKGKIDRIDRHRDTGEIRVIDYKTGTVKDVESQHRKNFKDSSLFPNHITESDSPITKTENPKSPFALWTNLQLPLYALAECSSSQSSTPIPCYIQLGKTPENIGFKTWDSFSLADLDSAKSCLDWITARIAARSFWPPADKTKYDDYTLFFPNSPIAEAFLKP